MTTLDELTIKLPSGKEVMISIDRNGVAIVPLGESEEDRDLLTYHELHWMLGVAFVQLGAHLKKVLLSEDAILNKGYNFYKAFHKNYKGIRRLEELTPQEFQEEIKKYDGRK